MQPGQPCTIKRKESIERNQCDGRGCSNGGSGGAAAAYQRLRRPAMRQHNVYNNFRGMSPAYSINEKKRNIDSRITELI